MATAAVAAAIGFQISPAGRLAHIASVLARSAAYVSLANKFFRDNAAIASVHDDVLVTRLQSLFVQAEATPSPLILDHDGNGFSELIGWVGADGRCQARAHPHPERVAFRPAAIADQDGAFGTIRPGKIAQDRDALVIDRLGFNPTGAVGVTPACRAEARPAP